MFFFEILYTFGLQINQAETKWLKLKVFKNDNNFEVLEDFWNSIVIIN